MTFHASPTIYAKQQLFRSQNEFSHISRQIRAMAPLPADGDIILKQMMLLHIADMPKRL